MDSWPSDVSAPLTINNGNNHSGLIVLLTGFCLCLHIVAISARVYFSSQKSTFSLDDYAFSILLSVAIIQVSLVFAQVHFGWGTQMVSVEGGKAIQMLKIGYAADIVSVLVLGLSKVTVCIFYEGLFFQIQHWLIRGLLMGMIIWTILSVSLLAIHCTPKPWHDISALQCGSMFSRWMVVTTIDIVTEAALLFYVVFAIYKVRLTTTKKIIVLCALESRILLVPLSAIRLHYVGKQLESESPTLDGSFATVCTEIYLALSVSCLLTGFLKSFIAVYEDDMGISYTTRHHSKVSPQIKSIVVSGPRILRPNNSDFYQYSRHAGNPQQFWRREREGDPIMENFEADQGLQTLKVVNFSGEYESIEFSEIAVSRSF